MVCFRGNRTYLKRISAFINYSNAHLSSLAKKKHDLNNSSIQKIQKQTEDECVSYSKVDFNETDYYFDNGLRKVYPYYHTFTAFCKQRWQGLKLGEMYSKEFNAYQPDILLKRIEKGLLLVNSSQVKCDYVLQSGDFLSSTVHRHELPVLALPIKIIHHDDDILVIEKPHSLPVHPIGLYRHNSVLFVLAKEHGIKGLYLNHRLDRLTSGLLIFSKTAHKCRDIHSQMLARQIKKTYVCRVEGEFPDGEITCDQPLRQIRGKIGICIVSKDGKKCSTKFQKLSYNGMSSVVLCKPLTGRMHQIRVHLQYLGYPIVNDILYNSNAFGLLKGKSGNIGKTFPELLLSLESEHSSRIHVASHPNEILEPHVDALNQNYLNSVFSESLLKRYKKDATRVTYDANCHFCNTLYKDPRKKDLMIYLHAIKYEGPGWGFETDMPEWAHEGWDSSVS